MSTDDSEPLAHHKLTTLPSPAPLVTPVLTQRAARPASVLKNLARVSWGHRMRVLEEIADGAPTQHIVQSEPCRHCGAEPELRKMKISASPRDRILAIAELGKIGFVSANMTMEEVGARLEETYQALGELLSQEDFAKVDARLSAIWS